eukprot:760807-Hanusia_phi.AAC.1
MQRQRMREGRQRKKRKGGEWVKRTKKEGLKQEQEQLHLLRARFLLQVRVTLPHQCHIQLKFSSGYTRRARHMSTETSRDSGERENAWSKVTWEWGGEERRRRRNEELEDEEGEEDEDEGARRGRKAHPPLAAGTEAQTRLLRFEPLSFRRIAGPW